MRCPKKLVIPGERLVCYSEPRPYVQGEQVQAYGGVVRDGKRGANIYSPMVKL